MQTIQIKAKIIKMLLKGLAKLPFGLAQGIGKIFGFLLYIVPNSLKKVVAINIQRCFPNESVQAQQRLMLLNLIHVAMSAAEYGAWWLWPIQKLLPLVKKVYGEAELAAAYGRGKGVLILAPHLGAWEVAQSYLPYRYRFSAMYRPLRFAALEKFVKTARERGGGNLLPLTHSGIRQAYLRLNRGELVIILPDQVPNKNSGVFAPFFGLSAWTMTLAIKIAQRSQAGVFIGYCERLGCGRGFDIHFTPASAEIFNPDLQQAAAAMNADIEACVRKIPEQYQWNYKRFKVQPQGSKKFYS